MFVHIICVYIFYNKFIATRWTPKLKINTNTRIAKSLAYNRMGGHIILTLGVFEPVAYGHMQCAQLRAAQIIDKKRRVRPDGETDRKTYKLDWTPLGDKKALLC